LGLGLTGFGFRVLDFWAFWFRAFELRVTVPEGHLD